MRKITHFELFVPVLPVPKSYRSFAKKTVLSDKCLKYQIEVTRFLEKYKPKNSYDGYLWVEYKFVLDRPQNSKNLVFPSRKPDHDNLVKSLQDCLENSRIISNDSRIISAISEKVFLGGENAAGIDSVGTKITLGEFISEENH